MKILKISENSRNPEILCITSIWNLLRTQICLRLRLLMYLYQCLRLMSLWEQSNHIRNKRCFLFVLVRSDLSYSIIEYEIFQKYFLAISKLKIIVWFMKVVGNDYFFIVINYYHLSKVVIVYWKLQWLVHSSEMFCICHSIDYFSWRKLFSAW
jgi:hypothetical protein